MIKMTRRVYSSMLYRVIRRQWWASFRFSRNRQMCGNPVLVFEVWQLLCIQLTPYWNSWRFRHINEHIQKESLRTSIFDQNNWEPKPKLRTQKLQKIEKIDIFQNRFLIRLWGSQAIKNIQKWPETWPGTPKTSPKLKIWDIAKFGPKPQQNAKNDD